MTLDADASDAAVPAASRVWFLTGEEVAATRTKLAKLHQRATAKGFTGRIDLTAVPATRHYHSAGGLDVTEHGFDVTLTGEPPRYGGWRFVAAVDHTDGGTILRYPPGADPTVANDQVRPGECDHCHTHRPRRSTVLVANDDTGHLLQVGRSCLKDFLGHNTLPVLLTVDDVAGDLGRGGGSPAAWDTDTVLAYAWASVQAFGWTPSSSLDPRRPPTRDVVRAALAGGRADADLRAALAPHLAEAPTQAPLIRQELLATLADPAGYQANLTAALRSDTVEARHLGLAVSAIPAHQRLLADRQRAQAREQAAAVVEHVGTVGDKVTLTGTVTTALRVDGYTHRSPDQVMLVVDCGTAVVKATTAAAWAYEIQVGDPLTVAGTVKAHTEWRGLKQTVLSRPKKIDPNQALPQATLEEPLPTVVWETAPTFHLDGAEAARTAGQLPATPRSATLAR